MFSYFIDSLLGDHRKSDLSNKLKSLTWSFVNSQPLISIRLTTYLTVNSEKHDKVWADSVSLATTPEIVIYFLFLALLRCFSSGGSLSITLCIQVTMHMTWLMAGFPIRKSPDQSLLTATRSLSQSSTSFIGNIRLGIHWVPLSTFLCIGLD